MSAGTYQDVTGGKLVPGQKYRVVMSLRAPYTDENIEAIETGWKGMTGIKDNVTVDSVTVSFPKPAPPALGTWNATIVFHVKETSEVKSGNFDIGSIGDACQAFIRGIISDVALLLTTVQQFITDTVGKTLDTAADALNKSVLNPGVLILAVVGIFLIVRR